MKPRTPEQKEKRRLQQLARRRRRSAERLATWRELNPTWAEVVDNLPTMSAEDLALALRASAR
jgi:hypothetical protein